jgi:spore coat protein CotH
LRRSPYDWVEASITVDDLSLNPVGLRLKGKVGSFRDLDSKAGFKVDFNRFDPELELAGLERLNLDNMVQDPSCNRDRLAYRIFEAVGIAVPRVGYAQVTVNGELFGLYALIESYDDVFLDRAYPDPSGNLYDGDYTLFEDGSYVLADFQPAWHDNFQLDEGQDVDREDIHRVTEALRESCDTEAFEDSVGAVVDLEQFAMFWAGEIWVGQWDGYAFNNNNIRVYFDPDDEGRAHLHPWDLDNAFSSGDWILSTSGELAQCCRRDEVCHARFHDSLEQIGQASGTLGLLGELDDALELIEPSLREDPRLEFDVDDVEDAHSELLFWLQVRENVLGNYPSL